MNLMILDGQVLFIFAAAFWLSAFVIERIICPERTAKIAMNPP